jgi:hypothetical protein
MKTRPNGTLILFLLVALPGCSSMTNPQPEPGRARIDVRPEKEKRDRIDGIRIVSVNGQPARGTEASLTPGRNRVRVGFKWPQGGRQELDLDFHAVAGRSYYAEYHVHPPYVNRISQRTKWDESAGRIGRGHKGGAAQAGALFVPPILALGAANTVEKVGGEIREQSKPAEHIDIMLVAKNGPEGVVRYLRAYPNGQVEVRR